MTLERARLLDQTDPFPPRLSLFEVPDPGLIYLDGNSLGRMPKSAKAAAQKVLDHDWPDRLIRSWNEGWMDLAAQAAAKIAPIIGAGQDEVVVTDQTSVNLFKAVNAALDIAGPGRPDILTDDLNFPSDLYILQGILRLRGQGRLHTVPSKDGIHGPEEGIVKALSPTTGVLALSHVAFKSGYRSRMKELCQAAGKAGALTVWDLSHSAGAVPMDLHQDGADFAVGCTYKYLNGGPGAPAYLFAHKKWHGAMKSPIWAWLGHRSPFEFGPEFSPAEGVGGFVSGTPPILSLAALNGALDAFAGAGMADVHSKSVRLQEAFLDGIQGLLSDGLVRLASPKEPDMRGSHVSLAHPHARGLCAALVSRGVVPDFRAPDCIRFGFAPLYNTLQDAAIAAQALVEAVTDKAWEGAALPLGIVT